MISIVIAAYNEEKRIGNSLKRISDYFDERQISHEILVVNDGSTDDTNGVLNASSLEIPNLKKIGYGKNRGKGYALRAGVLDSQGSLVLITDADLSTPIEEIENLLPFIRSRDNEIAIGSRGHPLSKIIRRQPWWRQGMGKIFNKIVRLTALANFGDTQCGFKLFKGEVARELFRELKTERFAFDVEILARAIKKNYRIVEIPVRWTNSNHSKVNPIIDSLIMMKDLFKIRLTVGNLKRF